MQELLDKLDILKIVKNGGIGRGFAFYSLGFVGTLLMTISLITIMMNSLDEDNMKILKAISELQKYDFNTHSNAMVLVTGNKNHQLDLVDLNSKFDQYEYPIPAFQTIYSLKSKQLQQSQYIQLHFPNLINKIQQNSCGQHCLNVKQKIINEDNCSENCVLYLQSVCLVFEENNLINGCYSNNQIAQYGKEKSTQISIQVRHNQDPSVLVNHGKLLMPKVFDPLILIIVGGWCLLGSTAIMLMIQINQKKDPIEIELQEIQRSPQRLIPLNY